MKMRPTRFDRCKRCSKLLSLAGVTALLLGMPPAFRVAVHAVDQTTLKPGTVIVMRGNQIVGSYGTGQTAKDRGDDLKAAVASLKDGDVLLTGTGHFDLDAIEIDDEIRWLARGTVVRPNRFPYISVITISSDNVIVDGVTVDGQGTANTGNGNGIKIANVDDVKLINCTCINLEGGSLTRGRGFYVAGNDIEVRNCVGSNNSYVGMRCSNANRLRVSGCRFMNNGNRSIEYDGSVLKTADFFHLSDTLCSADQANTRAFVNINQGFIIDSVVFDGVQIINRDQVSAGVSFDIRNREQNAKFQGIRHLTLRDCEFRHGINRNAGSPAIGFSFDKPFPKHIEVTGCRFSDGVFSQGGARCERLSFTECHFGLDANEFGSTFSGIGGGQISFIRCHFNVRSGVRVFTMGSAPPRPSDFLHIIDCSFVANRATDVNVADDNGPGLIDRPRRIISTGNTYLNHGAGDFVISTNPNLYLMLQTDRNGSMLFDSSDTRMPSPGSGPHFFRGVPGVRHGQKIINTRWNGSGVQYYVFTGTHWIAEG